MDESLQVARERQAEPQSGTWAKHPIIREPDADSGSSGESSQEEVNDQIDRGARAAIGRITGGASDRNEFVVAIHQVERSVGPVQA